MYIIKGIITSAILIGYVCARDEIDGQIFYRTQMGLTQVPTDIPSDIGQIYLDSNSLTNIGKNSFSNHSQCTLLSLRSNAIASIESGAFNGLSNLDKLDLAYNKIGIPDQNMFGGMPLLRVLNIAENSITSIPSGCFRDLGQLDELYLTANDLTTINGEMWIGLNSLTHFDLQFNRRMQIIPPGGLSNLPKLDLLHLHYNALKTFTMDIFKATDYPNSNGHPPILRLTLKGNPLICDSKLCWMKQAEQEGWLTWRSYGGVSYGPDCANNVNWNTLDLNCSDKESQCPTFNQAACESSCKQQNQVRIQGATDENKCLTCQCGSIITDQSDDRNAALTIGLVAFGSILGGILIATLVILLCLKRHGVRLCYKDSTLQQDTGGERYEKAKSRNRDSDHDYVDIDNPEYVNEAGPPGCNANNNMQPPANYIDIIADKALEEGPHQYQPLRKPENEMST